MGANSMRMPAWLGMKAAAYFVVLFAWVCALRWPFFVHDHFDWDAGLYYTISNRLLHGARLYVDLWDNKPVGIYLIYSSLLFISGGSLKAIILGSAFAVTLTAFLLGMIGWRVFDSRRAGVIAALVFPVYMLDLGADSANAENFFIPFIALSVLVLGTYFRSAPDAKKLLRTALAFGLIQGLALQIKFLIVFETALIGLTFAYLVWRRQHRFVDVVRLSAGFLAGFFLPTLIVLAYFGWTGGLDALVFSNFISPRLYVTNPFGLHDPLQTIEMCLRKGSYFAPLIALAGVIFGGRLLARAPLATKGAPLSLVVAWVGGAFLSAISTGQNSYHYFIPLAPPLCLLAALAADAALSATGRDIRKTVVVIAVLMVGPLCSHIAKTWERFQSPMPNPEWAAAEEVSRHAPAGSPILVIDRSPLLYGLSGMTPATRYPFGWHIVSRPEAYGVDPAAEVEHIFAQHPRLVVFSSAWLDKSRNAIGNQMRRHLAENYTQIPLDPKWHDLMIMFRRND